MRLHRVWATDEVVSWHAQPARSPLVCAPTGLLYGTYWRWRLAIVGWRRCWRGYFHRAENASAPTAERRRLSAVYLLLARHPPRQMRWHT